MMCQLKTKNIVTKLISEINFMSPGYQGDVIEIGCSSIGRSSIT
jgi:acyl-CoA hydrolase